VLTDDPEALARLRASYDAAALGALLLRPGVPRRREAVLLAAARRLGVAPVAACRGFFFDDEDEKRTRLLAAIRRHELWGARETARRERAGTGPAGHAAVMVPAAEAAARFSDVPAALRAADALAAGCHLTIEALAPGQVLLPRLGYADGARRLRARCAAGLRARPATDSAVARRRLENELRVIETLGFVDYFLVMGELVAWARKQGIPVMGRGSGAASLVAFTLGVTSVDPVYYRLCFERFLHPLRRDPPDLDLDIAWNRRDELLAYALRRFGEGEAALIGTHQFFRARGALRAAGRARGLDDARIARGRRRLPYTFFGTAAAPGGAGEVGEAAALERLAADRDRALAAAARTALQLLGLPRALGTHPAGLVLAPGPLCDFVPLERSAAGYRVTQFEMRAIERLGLVKLDLLGNRALATVAESRARCGGLSLETLPGDDPATGRRLARGETLGCIQLESPAMRTLLRQLDARDRERVIAAVALIRPGPAGSGMKEAFIARARGGARLQVLHPSLLTALEGTLGLPLYEEDVITMAALVGGCSLAQADLLRRAVAEAVRRARLAAAQDDRREVDGGGDAGAALARLERGFLAAAQRHGSPATAARGVWDALVRFAAYAFCKAHAAGYGVLAYQMAWLKTHHPGPFFAALLNHHRGMYPARVYLDEARRHGLRLRPPCIAQGGLGWDWTARGGRRGTLRGGLSLVRGLHGATAAGLLAARRAGPFQDLTDLARRVPASRPELEALVLSGACDAAWERSRGSLLWELRRWARRGARGAVPAGRAAPPAQASLGLRLASAAGPAGARGIGRAHRARLEWRFLGLCFCCHPAQLLPADPRATPIAAVLAGGARRVTVRGIVSAVRRVRDRHGRALLFLTLEDRGGLLECLLRPPLAERPAPRVDRLIRVRGRVRLRYEARTLEVEHLEDLGALFA
jgi:DNA-directed DNA polymerase III PolC